MTIKNKLYVGFDLFICLATSFYIFAYKEFFSVTLMMHHIEAVDNMNDTVIEVRRYEKNFLIYKDQTSINEVKGHLDALKHNAGRWRKLIIAEIGKGPIRAEHHNGCHD